MVPILSKDQRKGSGYWAPDLRMSTWMTPATAVSWKPHSKRSARKDYKKKRKGFKFTFSWGMKSMNLLPAGQRKTNVKCLKICSLIQASTEWLNGLNKCILRSFLQSIRNPLKCLDLGFQCGFTLLNIWINLLWSTSVLEKCWLAGVRAAVSKCFASIPWYLKITYLNRNLRPQMICTTSISFSFLQHSLKQMQV